MAKIDWQKPTKLTSKHIIIVFIICILGEIGIIYLFIIRPDLIFDSRLTWLIPFIIPFIMWLFWQQYKGKI